MKWTYGIKNKITAAILLAVILGLTMLTNLLQRKRFKDLEQSFASIYEDRLLAESYLFHLYVDLKKEQDLLQVASDHGMSSSVRKTLDLDRADRDTIMAKYAVTLLTAEEAVKFNRLQSILDQINGLEKEIKSEQGVTGVPADLLQRHQDYTTEAFSTLSALSDIQTAEGAVLRDRSKQIFMGSVSISHLEMTVLIIIAIIIQGLIFSSKTMLVKREQYSNLN